MKRPKNYPGTNTPVTGALNRVECPKCGYLNWHLMPVEACPKCGALLERTREEGEDERST